MTRLGLWGPGSPFPVAGGGDESEVAAIAGFVKASECRGVGAMELCALHLKREGALLCRTLSYKGAAFEVVEASLTAEQVKQRVRRADLPKRHRGGAAAATWTFCGDGSRRRRGRDADSPSSRGDAAAATRIVRGDGIAATPRPRRG